MTLDLAKFIVNAVKNQAKIQHLDINAKCVSQEAVPISVKKLISEQYGENYILDADYVAFFWGKLDKKEISTRLFNVVDKALGKSANRLTKDDFKALKLDDAKEAQEPEDDETEEIEDIEDVEDIEDDGDETEEVEFDDEETLDEDDGEDNDLGDIKLTHLFLKITIK